MGRIKDESKYITKSILTGNERLIGTDDDTPGLLTKNIKTSDILDYVSENLEDVVSVGSINRDNSIETDFVVTIQETNGFEYDIKTQIHGGKVFISGHVLNNTGVNLTGSNKIFEFTSVNYNNSEQVMIGYKENTLESIITRMNGLSLFLESDLDDGELFYIESFYFIENI